MFSLILLVNDGSGKLPAYRGLVDAVQSIVRTGGLKGLYQVSKINFIVKRTLCLETGLFVLIHHEKIQIFLYFSEVGKLTCSSEFSKEESFSFWEF